MPQRVIIDTDPGIDDALALLLALRSPELEIAAVTTVSGNVPVETATANVFRILSLLPDQARPPVAVGASRPLRKAPTHAVEIHGTDGLGGLGGLRDAAGGPRYALPPVTPSGRDAVEEILLQLSATPQPTTLLALGPLTNVATAIERDRETVSRAKRIVWMGGAIGVPGNVTPVAEFNAFVDPHAADIVFRAGILLTVVPLDVTRRVRLTRVRLQEAVGARPTVVGQFLLDCTARAFAESGAAEGEGGIFLHDPLAAGVVIDPSFVVTQPMHVAVETEGRITEGMTVADRRPSGLAERNSPNVQVCTAVDAPRFLHFFLGRVLDS